MRLSPVRGEPSLRRLAWEVEDELNEELWVALDLFGHDAALWLESTWPLEWVLQRLLGRLEEQEEYECCAQVAAAQRWLSTKRGWLWQELEAGTPAQDLIGL